MIIESVQTKGISLLQYKNLELPFLSLGVGLNITVSSYAVLRYFFDLFIGSCSSLYFVA